MSNQSKSSINRRKFIKGSAVAAGGLILNLPDIKGYHLGNDEIKVCLIGCGGRGTGAAAQALSTEHNVKLVAMADVFVDRLEGSLSTLKEKFTGTDKIQVKDGNKFVGFDAYKEAMAQADVVILTTPPGFRPIHFEAAVNAGKNIFTEKPMATDGPGIRRVLAAAEKAKEKNLKVVVGLQRHYETKYLELMKRIHGGEIGQITSAQCYWNDGGVWVKPRQPNQTEMEYQMRNWYYFNWICGDHIVEQHIHNLDVINWAKQAYPVSAQGMGGRQVRTGKEFGQIFDHHFVEFEYADGTVLSSQCRHIRGCMNKVAEAVQGTKGVANSAGEISDLKGNIIWKHDDSNDANPYQTEHDVFFDAVVNDKPINNAFYGAKSTMTAIMGRMATYSGQLVTWEDALNSDLDIMPSRYAWDAEPPVLPDENGFYPIPVPGVTQAF